MDIPPKRRGPIGVLVDAFRADPNSRRIIIQFGASLPVTYAVTVVVTRLVPQLGQWPIVACIAWAAVAVPVIIIHASELFLLSLLRRRSDGNVNPNAW